MAYRKKATDLFEGPPQTEDRKAQDPPVSKGMEILSTLDGVRLETVTRTNRQIVEGITAGSAYVARYNSPYIQARRDRLMRLAISMGGKGREEIIEIVKAGGQMADAYYERDASGSGLDYRVDD